MTGRPRMITLILSHIENTAKDSQQQAGHASQGVTTTAACRMPGNSENSGKRRESRNSPRDRPLKTKYISAENAHREWSEKGTSLEVLSQGDSETVPTKLPTQKS
ncbi:hypothetical protein OCU04_012919 [Sclerotinia nivalis]|uniref:Uncharacterized protein n=1 Tax=Sclerotinia nivalis TaxID=352851 RepID=A0A9X0A890_9HELO|nr:hypothetical protein OCU04_012919 [Sclerotinia nivalis]